MYIAIYLVQLHLHGNLSAIEFNNRSKGIQTEIQTVPACREVNSWGDGLCYRIRAF